MKLLVTCPCGHQMTAGDDLVGSYGQCPACGEQLLFPIEIAEMNTAEPSGGPPSHSGPKTRSGDPARTADLDAISSGGSPGRDRKPVNNDRGAALFVYSVWGLALAFALGLVAHFGHNAPFNDDFAIIPWWTGERPITLSWLWEPHNEHRIALPKLVLLALASISGGDFRAGMYFNVLALGGLALALVVVAKKLRGRLKFTDAVLPMACLHWGHYDNFLWCFQVGFVVPVVLTGSLLLIIVTSKSPFPTVRAFLAGVCLVLLGFCGAPGIAFVPGMACWLGYCGLHTWREGSARGKRNGIAMLAFTGTALLVVGLYFVQLKTVSHPQVGLWAQLRVSSEVLSLMCGLMAEGSWPYLAVGLVALSLFSAAFLVREWFYSPGNRVRTLGLFFFLGSMAVLALGIAWGRAWMEQWFGPRLVGFAPRYVTLAAPLLVCLYYVWQVLPCFYADVIHMVLFMTLCAGLPVDVQRAYAYAHVRHQALSAFEKDLAAGTPSRELAKRYNGLFLVFPLRPPEFLEKYLYRLHQAGIRPWKDMRVSEPPPLAVPDW
jgi:hypothetical protein